MKAVASLLNGMREAGVIADYALFGAAAQMRYTEAIATIDADVLVAVPQPDRLDVLGPAQVTRRINGNRQGSGLQARSRGQLDPVPFEVPR